MNKQQNKLQALFSNNKKEENPKALLSIFATAGYPHKESLPTVLQELSKAGVDFVEVGMPYSDPLADGPTIQKAGEKALANGMDLPLLFQQLKSVRSELNFPVILMGYFNQALQYGLEKFAKDSKEAGVDSYILPDLPALYYEEKVKAVFDAYDLGVNFLITPESPDERIKYLDQLSAGFLYVVANPIITGQRADFGEKESAFFDRLKGLNLESPLVAGFGISDRETFAAATKDCSGGIIGSAFIRALKGDNIPEEISDFISSIR